MPFDIINSEDVTRLIKSVNEMKTHLQLENEEKLFSQWVNGSTVCKMLKICNRTLFTLRKSERLKYSQVCDRKILYKLSDVVDFIQKNYK
jgi:hypothetical protein